MVEMEPFEMNTHDMECTIMHARSVDEYTICCVEAPKDTKLYMCHICERSYCKIYFLKLHLAERHDLFSSNFQHIDLPVPFIDFVTLLFDK